MKTYRYRGHSMTDPAKYRTKEEVDEMREEHDPIDHLRKELIGEGREDGQDDDGAQGHRRRSRRSAKIVDRRRGALPGHPPRSPTVASSGRDVCAESRVEDSADADRRS